MRSLIFLLLISHWCFSQSTIRVNNSKTQFSSYDADYQNVLSYAQSQGIRFPSKACMDAQNTLMAAIKSNIGLSAFDQIKVIYGDGPFNFTNINWVNPSLLISTPINNPLYIPLGGITNDPSSSGAGINTGVLGGNYTQNLCENVIYYSGLTANYSSLFLDGTKGNANNPTYTYFNPASSSASGGTAALALNDADFKSVAGFDLTDGLYFYGRTASNQSFARKGSASRVTAASTAIGISPWGNVLGAYSDKANTIVGYNNIAASRKFYLFTSGRLLTITEEASLKTAWDTYLTSIAAIPAAATIGTIYNVSSWSNLNDFTINGTTVTATSNQLQFTGGANTFTQSLDLTSIGGVNIGATKLSKWTQTIQFVVPTITASQNWIGFGIRSSCSYNKSGVTALPQLVFRMDLVTGTAGIMRIYSSTTPSLAVSTSAVSITSGDIISMTLTLNDGVATYSGYDVTTSSTPIAGSVGLYGAAGAYVTNTGHFAIFDGGGSVNTNKVNSWVISSSEIQGAKIAFVGDSKTQAYQATGVSLLYSIHNGFFYRLQDNYGPMVNLGGSGDCSADYLSRVYEIINWVRPQTVIINGVSNDIRSSISSATWQANIASVISQLQAAGINVIFWTGLYETNISQSAVSTWANAGIGCTVWDGVGIVLSLSADVIHPNSAGHATFANYALSLGKLPP